MSCQDEYQITAGDQTIYLKCHGDYWLASSVKGHAGGRYVQDSMVSKFMRLVKEGKSVEEAADEVGKPYPDHE